MLRSFFKKGGNNTPVHIANFLAEDLSCCRGVIGGGYTGNMFKHARLNMFKTYSRPTQKSEKRVRGRDRERKKKKRKSGDIWACRCAFQKPNRFTAKCRCSNCKESSMGPGNFSTKCLALEIPFLKRISIFIHGTWHFFFKMPWSAKVEVGPGSFYRVA